MSLSNIFQWAQLYPALNLLDIQYLWNHRSHFESFEQALKLASSGVPIEYLINKCNFGPFELYINEPLLIPREETWSWVQTFCETKLPQLNPKAIIELGVGSGAILTALSSKVSGCHFTAVDINPVALSATEKNFNENNKYNNELMLINSHWCSEIDPPSKFDLIISNPPYISQEESFWLEGVQCEDRRALFSDYGGYKDLYEILSSARTHLNDNAMVVLEHGAGMGPGVKSIAQHFNFHHFEKIYDNLGFWRATCLW